MTDIQHHTHHSATLDIGAIQWIGEPNCEQVFDILGLGPHPTPEEEQDHGRITLHGGHLTARPGNWIIRMIVRAPAADHTDRDALRHLLEYALATLDHTSQGPDAHLDEPEAQR
ncbi:MAG TPA: hypothetical protein VIV12_05135 [Streptosporangiaceae bacterium]